MSRGQEKRVSEETVESEKGRLLNTWRIVVTDSSWGGPSLGVSSGLATCGLPRNTAQMKKPWLTQARGSRDVASVRPCHLPLKPPISHSTDSLVLVSNGR